MKWRGREINAPHVIVWRLMLYPIIYLLGALLWLAIYAGWGAYDAKQFWQDTF